MRRGQIIRLLTLSSILVAGLIWTAVTKIKPERASLLVTAVIGCLTAIYALLTYEILKQNQTMAEAALESAKLTERGLRFSYSSNLILTTVSTRTTQVEEIRSGISAVKNEDYDRAIAIPVGPAEQPEFVFAIVENKGRGVATNVVLEAEYRVVDSSNPNRESVLTKRANVSVVEPNSGIALCVFMAKTPTPADTVVLLKAQITGSDFYRDAIGETAQTTKIEASSHNVVQGEDCIVVLR